MSYLKFDKSLMINLEQSLPKEMLRTNKSGAYHCTSIVGCNTRKQHGLLVIPIPEMDNKDHVLLSSLDETVIQHGVPFNLGIHQYGEGIFSPGGHKYIREFDCESYIGGEQNPHKVHPERRTFRHDPVSSPFPGVPQRQRPVYGEYGA